MFPNIDNNLWLNEVREALEIRQVQSPPTDCLLEAVELCSLNNNSQFGNLNFLQCMGTAKGPKNACSYADLVMGEIDELAKNRHEIKPMLLWRYRDDIVDIWVHGLPKLLEFTDFINALYPTIKFALVYSQQTLNVLDVTMHLVDGFIQTDVYSKPTDSHLYLPPTIVLIRSTASAQLHTVLHYALSVIVLTVVFWIY